MTGKARGQASAPEGRRIARTPRRARQAGVAFSSTAKYSSCWVEAAYSLAVIVGGSVVGVGVGPAQARPVATAATPARMTI
jgi:hypothetical protein